MSALAAAFALLHGQVPAAAIADDSWMARRLHARATLATPHLRVVAALDDAPVPSRIAPQGPVYRLPIVGDRLHERDASDDSGWLVQGAEGSVVIAPAACRIAYAGPFRRYGQVVILDHGNGWTSVLTGLSHVTAQQGALVQAGAQLGLTAGRIRVRLLHHGRAVAIGPILKGRGA